MAGSVLCADTAMDQMLSYISAGAKNKLTIVSTGVTSFADASTNKCLGKSTHLDFAALAASTMTAGGRRLYVAKTSDITIQVAGTAKSICIITSAILMYETKCTTRALTTADTATVSSWWIAVNDATTTP